MQIQYNITRIEEWCKSHDMPEGTLQLEHLMQATKLLQLKKVGITLFNVVYYLTWAPVHTCRYRDNLRCLLDVDTYANSAYVHQLLRRRLRGRHEQTLRRTIVDTETNRPLSLRRSFASWPPVSMPTTGTITYFFLQKRRRLGLMNCRCQETFLVLRHMYPHT
jgi:myosin heavy subunit